LAALDDEPGAWRRTALVFLECQNWRWQLAQMAGEPIVAHAAVASRAAAPRARPSGRGTFWGACLAVAGSLLVAFGLGTRFPTTASVQPLVADRNEAAAEKPEAPPIAGPPQETAPAGEERQWETLTLAVGDDAADAGKKFQVRARDADLDDATWMTEHATHLPAALIEQLEQEGWQVKRERHLLPVDLSDGRRMVVPVEQVDIRQPAVTVF
jgi:hypothetical protein